MTAAYADWPFWPDSRSDADQTRWWETCYVEASADLRLQGAPHWFLLAGGPGSGKTVALRAWQRREAAGSLILNYPPTRWPGASTAWFPDNPSHLAQMMATAGQAIAERLQLDPALLDSLDEFQREFLRSLLEFMGGPRYYRRFVAKLPPGHREPLLAVESQEEYFSDSHSWRGVQAQIEELHQLLAGMGWRRAVYVIDPPTPLGSADATGLAELLGWLDLIENAGLAVAAVVPDNLLEAGSLLARARGRVGLVYTEWTAAACRRVAESHLRAALPACPPDPLLSLVSEGMLDELNALVVAEYGRPSPTPWVGLAESLLYLTHRAKPGLQTPLRDEDIPLLKATYFRRHVRLRLDVDRHAVWRGPRLISLNDQHFKFLRLLQRRRGIINWDDDELRQLAGSENNVHTMASRTRQSIEPVTDHTVYLLNRRGYDGGYWLENCLDSLD